MIPPAASISAFHASPIEGNSKDQIKYDVQEEQQGRGRQDGTENLGPEFIIKT